MENVLRGTVKFYKEANGYGFISDEAGNDYFFHITRVVDEVVLEPGTTVEFTVVEGKKGFMAVNVVPVG